VGPDLGGIAERAGVELAELPVCLGLGRYLADHRFEILPRHPRRVRRGRGGAKNQADPGS